MTLAPGQTTTINLNYVPDPDLNAAQDMDLYVFSGIGTTFHGYDVVAKSAEPAGTDEQVTLFSPSGGTYSVVPLGWSIVRDQGFTLTSSNAPLTYEYEGYYLQTAGLGL